MANGKKPKKGIQVDPDIKKAYNKAVNTATDALVGPANQIAKSIGYKKVAKTAAKTLAGPAYPVVKGIYNYFNTPDKPTTKNLAPSQRKVKPEKIYDLGVLPEHKVVASKGESKKFNKSLKEWDLPTESQGAENMKKAPIIPAKNPLQNRSDLKRNSAAMMKVKNPQKNYE